MTIVRKEAGLLNSKVVEYNGFVFVSGLTARDQTGTIESQTEQVLADIDRYLALAGTNKSRLLQAQVWLSDMRDKDRMNSVWTNWVGAENKPARALVEAKLATPEALVEFMVIAAK